MAEVIEPQSVKKDVLLGSLPPPWPDEGLRRLISQRVAASQQCIVALDDDPTGCQTVYDTWVLTRWEIEDLRAALAEGGPLLFILTNSRSMELAEAQALNREIAGNLAAAARAVERPFSVVSRSDSTLRGHFPGEVEALADGLADATGLTFDSTCLVPCFPEGGRLTIGDIHWVQEGDQLVPAAQTAYARDPAFGYSHSRLPEWVEEKTNGRVPARRVRSISLETLRRAGPEQVARQLAAAAPGSVIAVNAADYRDLEVFVAGLQRVEAQQAVGQGRRFLFRTAASFVKVAAGLPDRPLLAARELVASRPQRGGLTVVGSFVPMSTAQLAAAQALDGIGAVELPVKQVLEEEAAARKRAPDGVVARVTAAVNATLAAGRDALLYTSRELALAAGGAERRRSAASLAIGQTISSALVAVVRGVEGEPRYVIGKGGITASVVATDGLDVRAAWVLGQVLPGVPVWQLGPGSRWPGLPYVVFPGNVGDERSLAGIIAGLRAD